MAGFMDDFLVQDLTYWAPSSRDVYGEKVFSAPIKIKGRREDSSELFSDALGQEVRSQSIYFVDRDLEVGGFLILGSSSIVDPTTVAGAFEIRSFGKIPNIEANDFERKALL